MPVQSPIHTNSLTQRFIQRSENQDVETGTSKNTQLPTKLAHKIAILPAAIVQTASRAARLWCLVRSLDHPDNGGTGSGLVRISLAELGQWLNRSERSVWRYISEALAKKYIHSCVCEYGQLRIEYRGLKSLAKHLGLKVLGAIGQFPLEEICHVKTRATDIATEKLQAQSFHQMKEQYKKFAKGARQASDLLVQTTSSAKVPGDVCIARGDRLLYLAPHWRPFGGSQQGIADRLRVSLRTVQYRLSHGWREERGIPAISKAQSAHQILEECSKEFVQNFYRLEENTDRKYVFLGSRLFEIGCNLYDCNVQLRAQRRQQSEYRVLQKSDAAGGVTACSLNLDCLEEETEKIAKAARL